MSDINPYKAPEAPVQDIVATSENRHLTEPRMVSPGRGWSWIAEGFNLFKMSPGIWIGLVVIWVLITVVISLVPLLGVVANLIGPVFMAGFMLGCAALEKGEELEIAHLFAGFQQNPWQLVLVGVIYLVGILIIALFGGLMIGLVGAGTLFSGLADSSALSLTTPLLLIILICLVIFALAIPLIMAYWFAPALVVFGGFDAIKAMKLSFKGSLKNILPFLVYGIVTLVLCVLAAIPILLGFLVLGPVMLASIYTSYKDIFLEAA